MAGAVVLWWAWLAAVGAVECQPLAAAHNGATADIINYDSSQTLHTPPPQLQSLVLLLLLLCGFHPVAALLCLCRRAPGDSTPYLVELEKGPSEGL